MNRLFRSTTCLVMCASLCVLFAGCPAASNTNSNALRDEVEQLKATSADLNEQVQLLTAERDELSEVLSTLESASADALEALVEKAEEDSCLR